MKIFFVRPAQIHWRHEAKRVGTPIGLLSIAALAKQHHDVAFLDVSAEGYDLETEIAPNVFRFGLARSEIERRIRDYNPDVVAVSNLFTLYWRQALEIAEIAKAVNPAIVTVLGGNHSSGVPRETLFLDQGKAIDYLMLGESEDGIVSLLWAIEAGDAAGSGVEGIAYREGNEIIVRPRTGLQRISLQALPRPAWELLKVDFYHAGMSHFGEPRGENFVDVMASRGCPTGCNFCTTTDFFGRKMRTGNVDHFRKDVRQLVDAGWKEIVVEDDNFAALPRPFQRAVCEILAESGVPWNADGGIYYPRLDETLASLLAEHGCYRVFLPVESPDLSLMHSTHKYLEFDTASEQISRIRQACLLLNSREIEFYAAIMVGFPGQQRRDIVAACEFAKYLTDDLGAIGISFHWAHPYPGTKFYDESYMKCPPERRWQSGPEYYSFVKPVFPLAGMSLEEMEATVLETLESVNGTSIVNASCFMRPPALKPA